MSIQVYLDEDAQADALLRALRVRGVAVSSAREAGLSETDDEVHLAYATQQRRVLFSYNVRDYYRLHGEWLRLGRAHAGLILAPQQQYSPGEITRRLLRLIAARSAEQMQNRIEFLSAWH